MEAASGSRADETVSHEESRLVGCAESSRLRVLGQELEQRGIIDFEILVDGDGYRVKGHVVASSGTAWRKLRDMFKFRSSAVDPYLDADTGEWERRYSDSELDRLDAWYKARRAKAGIPDDYAISQVLRVVGAYAARRRWMLTGVVRQSHMIEITHRDEGGQLRTAAQPYAVLYDFAIHMHGGRNATA